ncbi:hypothetical protein BH11GEM2_BH11GEM2_20700 [soil metagenome]|jgi:AbrB family looped-hinge helix DNA binding protein
MLLLPPDHLHGSGNAIDAVEVRLERDGRVILPVDVRQRLGIQPGDTLLMDVTDQGVLLWTREMATRELRQLVSANVPAGASLVAELRLIRRDDASVAEQPPQATPARTARGRR